jgi:hypothetical protein
VAETDPGGVAEADVDAGNGVIKTICLGEYSPWGNRLKQITFVEPYRESVLAGARQGTVWEG